jgi:hypothetical protein
MRHPNQPFPLPILFLDTTEAPPVGNSRPVGLRPASRTSWLKF